MKLFLMVAVIGLVGYLIIAGNAPLKDRLVNELYPKSETHAAEPYIFGTLETDPARAVQEYNAGVRAVLVTAAWKDIETADNQWNQAQIDNIKQKIQTFRNAGMKVILSPAIHYPPDWLFTILNSEYQSQWGTKAPTNYGFREPNYVFNLTIRDRVERFTRKIIGDIGPTNLWAVRFVNGLGGEVLYPNPNDGQGHQNSYWAYDINAQMANGQANNRPSNVPANPFPGWKPGDRTYNGQPFTTTQVQQWYDWYFNAKEAFVNWHIDLYRSIGFNGQLQLQTPGYGTFPNRFTNDINNYLDGSSDIGRTTSKGALWYLVYSRLINKNNIVAYVSAMADASGNPSNNLCQSTDAGVALNAPQIESWSGTRWVAYLADKYGILLKDGENPGFGDGAMPYGYTMMAEAAKQMQSCNFQGMHWAHDQNLYNNSSGPGRVSGTNLSLSDYQYVIAQYNSGATPAPTVAPTSIATSCPVPPIPVNLTPTGNISPGSYTLRWDPVPNANRYAIRIDDKTTPLNPDIAVDTLTTNSFAATFQAGRTYNWWVTAFTRCYQDWNSVNGTDVIISTSTPAPTLIPSPSPTPIQGDADKNGKVDIFDYNMVLRYYRKTGSGIQGDLDKDGDVDIFDYNIILRDYGKN